MESWFRRAYTLPLRLLAWLVDLYAGNRGRLQASLTRPHLARIVRGLVIVTGLLWLLVFLFADPRHGERLDQAFRDMRHVDGLAAPSSVPLAPEPQ